MTTRACFFGMLLLLLSLSVGCSTPLPTSEPTRDAGPQEPTAPEPIERSKENTGTEPLPEFGRDSGEPAEKNTGEEVLPEPPAQEPASDTDDAGAEPSQDAGEPIADIADGGPPPEQTFTEPSPDSPKLNPSVTSAVSLRASFLNNSLKAGLMLWDKGAKLWTWEGVVDKGGHTFAIVLNNNSKRLYTLQTGWKGTLSEQPASQSFALTETTRLRFVLSLKTRQLTIERETAPGAIQLTGSWNGNGSQRHKLTRQADGTFVWVGGWNRGSIAWGLETGTGATLRRFVASDLPNAAVDVAGSLQRGSSGARRTLSRDTKVRLQIDLLRRRWKLTESRPDAATAWVSLQKLLTGTASATQKTTAIQAFLSTYRRLRQLPITQGTKVTFVLYKKPRRAPFYVSGSFNQWDKSLPMKRFAGTDLYFATRTLSTNTRHEYKFRDASDQWSLDPTNPRYVYAGFGPNSVLNLGDSGKSHLERFDNVFATKLKNRRSVRVYVPAGARPGTRLPVLYMHDGQNLYNPKALWGGWGVQGWADRLIAQKKMRPFLIVGVDNTPGRMDEYTQTTDRLSGKVVGGKAPLYADFLWRDVKPWVDAVFPTRPGFRSTAVMGSSLGGLVSFWMGWTNPRKAFRIGALSSTFRWGQIGGTSPTMLDLVKAGDVSNMVVYLDSGSPNDNMKETQQMRDLLKRRGYLEGLNLQYYLAKGALHNEAAWRARLGRPLQFLCGW